MTVKRMQNPARDTVRGMNSPEPAVERIARLAAEHDLTIAAAESLTSGLIASRLGAGPQASEWFRGSVVAYQEPVKFDVLGVRRGPLVDPDCAEGMARGVGRLLGADVAVAATGVGGPDPSEGKPAGTVYVAVTVRGSTTVRELDLDGDPEEILEATADHALDMLAAALEDVGRPAVHS
jgi:nicotinamide-nucleotide amidase